jgi:vacuolar-type H+-ATPase subunit I/STV1
MVAGGRIFQETNCDESGLKDTIRCDRIKFSVGLGAASGFFCMLWMAAGAFVSIPAMVDTFMSSLMLIAWTFGIAVITFGGESKAAAPFMGNLYFFTWGSFGLASRLVAADAFDMIGSFMGTEEEEVAEDKKAEQEEVAGDEEAGVEEEAAKVE